MLRILASAPAKSHQRKGDAPISASQSADANSLASALSLFSDVSSVSQVTLYYCSEVAVHPLPSANIATERSAASRGSSSRGAHHFAAAARRTPSAC